MSFGVLAVIAVFATVSTLTVCARAQDSRTRAAAALTGGSVLLAAHAFGFARFRSDDAYITYRYARNLADGLGPVWNRGEHVEGYTSFLWMLLLAGMHAMGIDIEVAAVLLATASTVALFVLLWRVSLLLFDGEEHAAGPQRLVLAGAILLVAANTSMGIWSVSGLEMPLAAALIVALIYTYQRESRSARFPLSALVLGAAVMTRPEAGVLVALTGGFFVFQTLRENTHTRRRHLALFVAIFAILAGAWVVWRWSYYGYIFPNTYYVKVGTPGLMIDRGLHYVGRYWLKYLVAPALAASMALPLLLRGAPRRDAAFICAVCAVWLAAVVFEGGDVFFEGRFIAPVIAPMYLALAAAVARFSIRLPGQLRLKELGFALAVAGGAVFFLTTSRSSQSELAMFRGSLAEWKVEGRWIRQNVPPDYVTAVSAAGAAPYFSQRPSLDMLGLTDETIAHTDVPHFPQSFLGHEKYNLDYVLDARRPEIILLGGTAPQPIEGDRIRALSRLGPQPGIVPGLTKLLQDERTWERYEMGAFFFRGLWYHFLVRKDIEDNVNAGWIESMGMINNGSDNR
jgi:arabinofuranosyltransferase